MVRREVGGALLGGLGQRWRCRAGKEEGRLVVWCGRGDGLWFGQPCLELGWIQAEEAGGEGALAATE